MPSACVPSSFYCKRSVRSAIQFKFKRPISRNKQNIYSQNNRRLKYLLFLVNVIFAPAPEHIMVANVILISTHNCKMLTVRREQCFVFDVQTFIWNIEWNVLFFFRNVSFLGLIHCLPAGGWNSSIKLEAVIVAHFRSEPPRPQKTKENVWISQVPRNHSIHIEDYIGKVK